MTAKKFTVIYSFILHEGKSTEFIHAWTELTKLIYQYEGSYGSCLHRASDILFIGYAQWPSLEQWEQSGSRLPANADKLRTTMRSCCVKIKTEYELAVVSDLLHDSLFSELDAKTTQNDNTN